eukprot:Rhum_TRINITY_DN15040_c0_g1::Rhum_TRINITY_DN15040_c0_g1_i5::g.134771::m.134771
MDHRRKKVKVSQTFHAHSRSGQLLHAELGLHLADQPVVSRQLVHRRARRPRRRVAALRGRARRREHVEVVHDRLAGSRAALAGADVVLAHHQRVVVEAVDVALQLRADAEALPDVAVDVVVVHVVVAAEVVLHALVARHKHVVVRVVVRAAVVVVHTLLQVVVVDEEVLRQLAPLHLHRRLARAHRAQERLAVPRVERAVVAALPARREHQVARQEVAAAQAVVEVDARTRAVEEDVVQQRGLGHLALEVERRLLLVVSHLARKVVLQQRVPRVVAVRAVEALQRVGARLVRLAPSRHRVSADPRKLVVRQLGVPVVRAHHHAVAVQAGEEVAVNRHVLRVLKEHRPDPVKRPVTARRHAVRLHVRVPSSRQLQAADGHVLHGVPPRLRRHVEQRLQLRRNVLGVRRRRGVVRRVVVEVHLARLRVEEELVRVVELLEHVLHKPVAALVVAARTLEPAASEGEVARAHVVVAGAHLEHPVRPASRPPHVDDHPVHVLVRQVEPGVPAAALRRDRGRLRRHALRHAEREGAAAHRVLRAPVRHRRVVDVARAADADHVPLEPVVREVAHLRRVVVRHVRLRPLLRQVGRRPRRGASWDHLHTLRVARLLLPLGQLDVAVRVACARRADTVDLKAGDALRDLLGGGVHVGRVHVLRGGHLEGLPLQVELGAAADAHVLARVVLHGEAAAVLVDLHGAAEVVRAGTQVDRRLHAPRRVDASLDRLEGVVDGPAVRVAALHGVDVVLRRVRRREDGRGRSPVLLGEGGDGHVAGAVVVEAEGVVQGLELVVARHDLLAELPRGRTHLAVERLRAVAPDRVGRRRKQAQGCENGCLTPCGTDHGGKSCFFFVSQ